MDLGSTQIVTGVVTQGFTGILEHVKTFKVKASSTSATAGYWDVEGGKAYASGASDASTRRTNVFGTTQTARWIRIYPQTYQMHMSMRAGVTVCIMPCPAGRFFGAGDAVCTDCPAGRFSDAGAAVCTTDCPAGRFAASGSSACSACGGDSKYSAAGASNCATCAAGSSTAGGTATTRTSCAACPPGYHSCDGSSMQTQ
jgi:hypothetical protein